METPAAGGSNVTVVTPVMGSIVVVVLLSPSRYVVYGLLPPQGSVLTNLQLLIVFGSVERLLFMVYNELVVFTLPVILFLNVSKHKPPTRIGTFVELLNVVEIAERIVVRLVFNIDAYVANGISGGVSPAMDAASDSP